MEVSRLLNRLHELPPVMADESLSEVLETLWRTRKTGLSLLQKSNIKSLLNLPDSGELDPVLSCLRLIIRKVSKEKLTGEDIQKLFPAGFSPNLKNIFTKLLHEYQEQWDKEIASDLLPKMMFLESMNAPPAFAALQSSDLSLWPREDNIISKPCGVNNGCSIQSSSSDWTLQHKATAPAFWNNGSSDNLAYAATFAQLKTMTWSIERSNLIPENRFSIITLKLEDYNKPHTGEVEVKFMLSRETLEAMLRSMTCISDQFSNSGRLRSEPDTEKQRQ